MALDRTRYDNLILKVLLNKKGRISSVRSKKLYRYTNITNYLNNRYDDSFSIQETINRIHYNVNEHPKCPVCGKYVAFAGIANGVVKFKETCSIGCANRYKKLERIRKTCLERYGTTNGGASSIAKEKIKETCKKRYGVDHPWKSKEVRGKCQDTLKEKYGIDSTFELDSSKESMKERYGVDNIMSLDSTKEKVKETCKERYGADHPWKNKEVRKKCLESFKKSTGYNSPIQMPGIAQKVFEIRKKNGTTNTSKPEEYIYNILKEVFEEVERQYTDDRYPWHCDFYIPSQDLYIEYQGFQGHGGHPYNENDEEDVAIVKEWQDRYDEGNHPLYKSMIDTWTKSDVQKRNWAKEHNLRWCEFFNVKEFDFWLCTTIRNSLMISEEKLDRRFEQILNHEGKLSMGVGDDCIVKYFQQANIYKLEYDLYDDLYIRYKLMRNREKYLFKDSICDITIRELLNGFKISGIHYGFSMFNPMLAKWFVENYASKDSICYDPTGGWGHRLLGIAPFVKKYIYNDLSEHTVEGVKTIAKYFNINNVEYHNEDATSYEPTDDYDCMFTCPPYYADNRNTEEYECDGFTSQQQYADFIYNIYEKYEKKESCKVFGIVIREDMLPNDLKEKANVSYCLTKNNRTHYNRTEKVNRKRYYEYLYIFNK